MKPSLRTLLAASTAACTLSFAAQAQISLGAGTSYSPGLEPSGIAFGDFDGDMDRDMAITVDNVSGALDGVSIHLNDGTGQFTPGGIIPLGAGVSVEDVVAADFDNNGTIDLAVSLKDQNAVRILTNGGAANFTPGALTAVGGLEPRQIAVGDIDGVGGPDLMVANRDSNNVSVLLSNGAGFTFVGTVPAGIEPRGVVLAHLNGDTILDAAVAAHDSRSVIVLNGLGGGAFAQGASLFVGGQVRPEGLAAADVDQNGTMDLLAATSGNNGALSFVALFTNNGGTFAGPVNFPSGGSEPDDVAAADLDGDGDMDVVVSNQTSNTIATLENLGGTFGAAVSYPSGVRPGRLAVEDLDGNGSPDVGVACRDSNDVRIYLNNAAGSGIGTNYCNSTPNSTGSMAVLSATGSASIAANDITLNVASLPASHPGLFLISNTAGFTPFAAGGQGHLCLGTPLARFGMNPQFSSPLGTVSMALDLQNLPQGITVAPGETWFFQYWTRDTNLGFSTNNLSNGLSIDLQ